MNKDSLGSPAREVVARSGESGHIAELVDLFQREKPQLCRDWLRAIHWAGVTPVPGRDVEVTNDCEPVFDRYVDFVHTQSEEAQVALSDALKTWLDRMRPEIDDQFLTTAKIGQRQLHDILTKAIVRHANGDVQHTLDLLDEYQRRAHAVVVESINVALHERELTIQTQQQAIRELSTPVLQVRDRLLICPLIGVIDPDRARQVMEQLLHRIRENRARCVVIDITGVPVMDAQVANSLVQTVMACRLVGASVIVSGISSEIARTLVRIGVDLAKMDTTGDLQGAIEEAEWRLGYRWTREEPRHEPWGDDNLDEA